MISRALLRWTGDAAEYNPVAFFIWSCTTWNNSSKKSQTKCDKLIEAGTPHNHGHKPCRRFVSAQRRATVASIFGRKA